MFVTPSNTIISVEPPTNDVITPAESAANVCESFVKNAVTESTPSEPGWIPNSVKVSDDAAVPPEEPVNALTSYVLGVDEVGFSIEVSTLNVFVVLLLPWMDASL